MPAGGIHGNRDHLARTLVCPVHRHATRPRAAPQRGGHRARPHGRGRPPVRRQGQARGPPVHVLFGGGVSQMRETVRSDTGIIGMWVSDSGETSETDMLTIHYSKRGVHIVPSRPSTRRQACWMRSISRHASISTRLEEVPSRVGQSSRGHFSTGAVSRMTPRAAGTSRS